MRWLLIAFLLAGCASKELGDAEIKKMIADYFTPYSSVKIAKFVTIEVRSKKPTPSKVQAKVCYTVKFFVSYDELVRRIKEHPNSFLARFDFGLVALYGRKFGNFKKGQIKSRCDEVEFERRYGKWMIKKI